MQYRDRMRITETITYPATPAVVFAMLTDERFQERKCIEAGALHHDVAVTGSGSGARVVTNRDLPTDRLPDFVKSFVGASLSIAETYEWAPASADGSRNGILLVEVKGAPVSMRATVVLAPSGPGTQLRVDGVLKASIPLLGGRIEKAAAPAVVGAMRSEQDTARAWLAEHP